MTLGSTGTSRQPITFWLWVADRLLEVAHLRDAARRIAREEHLRDAVVAGVGELDAEPPHDALVVRVGDLEEDARAVAGRRIGARGAAVLQPAQDLETLFDDVVAGRSVELRHESETTHGEWNMRQPDAPR